MSKYHLSPYIRLVIDVAKQAGVPPESADKVIRASFENIMALTAEGQTLRFLGFGAFSVKNRQARKGRNPYTGETLQIPEQNRVFFKPSPRFKEAVNPNKKTKAVPKATKATKVKEQEDVIVDKKPAVKKKMPQKKGK